jgi:dipeptidase E
MRLFLCSSTMTRAVSELTDLVGAGARVGVMANALDDEDAMRREALANETTALARAGLDPFELDLRRHYGQPESLRGALTGVDMVWATGGNVFMLIDAMRRSGFDVVLHTRLRDDTLAFGGCSAGACVCGPTLRGFELIDEALPEGGPSWDGLGLIRFTILPHFKAAGSTGRAIDRVVAYYRAHGLPYRALRDGQAIVVHDVEMHDVDV